MNRRTRLWTAATTALLVAVLISPAATAGADDGAVRGFRALAGDAAATFAVPDDTVLSHAFAVGDGTYERHVQRLDGAAVLGGETTVWRDAAGTATYVVSTHYEGLSPTNEVRTTRGQAARAAEREVGPALQRTVDLVFDPEAQAFRYRVESIQRDARWFHLADAQHGRVVHRWNAIDHACDASNAPCGYGAAFHHDGDSADIKDLTGLTSGTSPYALNAERIETHDQGSTNRPFLGPVATDSDGAFTLSGRASPGQGALVDAHAYGDGTDDYLLDVHGFDWVRAAGAASGPSKMVIHAHYSKNYVNAFWNGSYAAFGDGDGVSFRELTSADVVGHELTHGVTDFTSDLVYQNESGALNESFSDMVGTALEFWLEANLREPGTELEPDYLIGEDFDLRTNADGFRNMADPEEDGDPDHYSERYTGTSDNGGVHTNSAISNHAFHLLAEGGQNASCAEPETHNNDHCAGVGLTVVPGIGLADTEDIFFRAMTSLSSNATFCEARDATIAAARTTEHAAAVAAAWDAVGVCPSSDGGGGDTNASPTATFSYSCTDLSCSFDGSDSTDPDGDTLAYSWTFGDESSATGATSSHTFASDGTYTVILTVDDGSATDTSSQDVTVTSSSGDQSGLHVERMSATTSSSGPEWSSTLTVLVHDGDVAATSVTVAISWATERGVSGSASCTTGGDGTCSVEPVTLRKRDAHIDYRVDTLNGTEAGSTLRVTKP